MAGTLDGQLWFIGNGGANDAVTGHLNSDGGNITQAGTQSASDQSQTVGVDLAAGYYFTITGLNLETRSITNPSVVIDSVQIGNDVNTPSTFDDDVVNAVAINPLTHTLYVGLWGQDPQHTGIVTVNYNTTTGALDPAAAYGTAGVYDNDTPYLVQNQSNLTDIRDFSIDTVNNVLYYTDDDNQFSGFGFNATNGIYKISLSGGTPVLLSDQTQFPTDQSNGIIGPLAVDVAKGLIYFETNNVGDSTATLWYMPINGGTATQVTLPAGSALGFDDVPQGGISIDPQSQYIFITVQSGTNFAGPDEILQGQLSADGHSVTSWVNTYPIATLDGHTPDPNAHIADTWFDQLPTLSLSGTASHAVEQGANLTLLSAAPSITDTDGNHLNSAIVHISAGTFSSNETSANDDHLTIASAHRTGTDTSGTINGTSISYSYNSGTETLTLSGYDTISNYQSALSFVQYFATGDNPTNYGNNTTRTVQWTVSDGAPNIPFGAQNSGSTTLNIDGKNDAPVASAPATYSEQEHVAKNLHNASLNVSDVDGGIAGQNETATLSVTEGVLHAVAGTGTSLGVGISGDGTSTLTITGTIAQINGLLNGDNTSILTHTGDVDANDTPNSITLSLSVNDNGFNGVPPPGAQTSNTATSTITAPDDTTVTFTGLSSNTTGSPVEGQLITASISDGAIAVSTATYTWKVNGSTVQTGSSNTYTPTEADEGGTLTLDVAFNDPVNASIAENDTVSVGSPNTVQENPTENASISISGTTGGNAVEGTQLTATVTDLDAPASGITYTWKVNNITVHTGVDAAGKTYTPTESDEGLPISVSVSFTDTHGNAGETGTASAGIVQESPTENASISISGTTAGNAVEGVQLTATVTEGDSPGVGITYTWKVNNVTVHTGVDAAGKTYTPTENDEGLPVSVSVSFTDTHGFAETGTASAGTVQESPTENASISISGTTGGNAVVGTQATATVTEGDAPGSGITYTWKVNNVVVHTGVDAAGNTYTPTNADNGKPIDVSVSFTDTHGFAETGTASAGTVQEPPITGHMVLTSATEHVALANTTVVATFTDGNLSDTASDFTATIDWGDGVTTSGTVVGSSGTFSVEGSHSYADEGTDTAVVTLTHHPDNSQATASGPVTVGEHDVLTGHDMHAAIVVNQPFSGVIGHFTDTDHVTPASDLVATIDWGDGATTSGTVSGSNGSFDVSGTHAYTTVGLHNVHVTLADDAPGTATATADAKIVFNTSNGHHSMADTADTSSLHLSVDGTEGPAGQTLGEVPVNWDMVGFGQFSGPSTDSTINTDALFHSDAGQVVMWQTQNGELTTDQLIGQLPTNYQFAGIGDFNGDGKSDVLWQSDSGHIEMWEMNGTQVAVDQEIGQVPTNWHVSSVSDVNGDGNSDIIFTSDVGAQRVWEMNGTQVVADQAYDPNGPLASHVLDTHAPTMPAVAQPADPGSILGGIAGALHDPHFLV